MSEKKEDLKFALILLLSSHKYSTRAVAQYVYPYYLSKLACAVLCFFPTTFLEIAVYSACESSFIHMSRYAT